MEEAKNKLTMILQPKTTRREAMHKFAKTTKFVGGGRVIGFLAEEVAI